MVRAYGESNTNYYSRIDSVTQLKTKKGEMTMGTRQPEWELVANLGDRNWIDYGGYFVYKDKTGCYTEEGEMLCIPEEGEGEGKYVVYRFCLDKCKLVEDDETHVIYLVSANYDPSWPYPLSVYDEWFHEHLVDIASSISMDWEELRDLFCSDNPIDRAIAYRAIVDCLGYENLDSYPLTLTKDEVKERYNGKYGK